MIPGLAQWVEDPVLSEQWCRSQMLLGSHITVPVCRLEATALIRPLVLEPPYAMGAALKRQKKDGFYNLSHCQM